MAWFKGWYGAHPLHLLSLLACFGLAGYAAVRLLPAAPMAVLVWFGGSIVAHDLLLFPLYALADRSSTALARRRLPPAVAVSVVNHLRVPALFSGLLLLVWFPLITRRSADTYQGVVGLSADVYLGRWLLLTGAAFGLSSVLLSLRLRRRRV